MEKISEDIHKVKRVEDINEDTIMKQIKPFFIANCVLKYEEDDFPLCEEDDYPYSYVGQAIEHLKNEDI
jgi:hypothetical protein